MWSELSGLSNKLSFLREDTMYGMVLDGTFIQYVNPLGPASLKDLREGDLILAINGYGVQNEQDIVERYVHRNR